MDSEGLFNKIKNNMLVNIPESYLNQFGYLMPELEYLDTGIFQNVSRWNPAKTKNFYIPNFTSLPTIDDIGTHCFYSIPRTPYGLVDRLSQISTNFPELLNSPRKFHLYIEKLWERNSSIVDISTWPYYEPSTNTVKNYQGDAKIYGDKLASSTANKLWFFIIYESV